MKKRREVWVIEWLNSKGKWETWQIHGPTIQERKDARRLTRRARRVFAPYKFRLVRYVPEERKVVGEFLISPTDRKAEQ